MLAHEQGAMVNAAKLAAGLGVSGQTVARYMDLMVDVLLVRRLHPWAVNTGKRLVRSPKIQSLGLLDGLSLVADICSDSVGQALASAALPKHIHLRRTAGSSDRG